MQHVLTMTKTDRIQQFLSKKCHEILNCQNIIREMSEEKERENMVNKTLHLIQESFFFHAYGDSAEVLSAVMGYKLVKVSRNKNEIYRCGFPTEAMDKVIDRLTHKKISYCFCSDKKSGCRILEEKDFGTDNNFEMVISGMVSKGHRKNILIIECDEH